MNPAKLSLLTDQELLLLAERMGIYIPEGLDRPFVIEEIIAALEDDTQERVFSHDGTGHVEEKKLSGGTYIPYPFFGESGLPTRYNETMIRALPRDPAWIYAYWDISERKRGTLEADTADLSLFLRIAERMVEGERHKDFFDIPITFDDWKWYINIPQPGATYRVDLCVRKSDKVKVLARSNEVRMPVHYMRRTQKTPPMTDSLLILSGLDGLHLTEPGEEHPARILTADED